MDVDDGDRGTGARSLPNETDSAVHLFVAAHSGGAAGADRGALTRSIGSSSAFQPYSTSDKHAASATERGGMVTRARGGAGAGHVDVRAGKRPAKGGDAPWPPSDWLEVEGSAVPPAPRVDAAQLLRDMAALADPKLRGRRPGSDGSEQARRLIEARIRHLGLWPVEASAAGAGGAASAEPFRHPFQTGVNLIARVPCACGATDNSSCASTGTAEEWTLVLSAHYDHLGVEGEGDPVDGEGAPGEVYCGADDNASGCAALLNVCRHVLASGGAPCGLRVLGCWFDDEESGFKGALAFTGKPPAGVSADRIVANLNVDMIARADGDDAARAFARRKGTSGAPTGALGHPCELWVCGAGRFKPVRKLARAAQKAQAADAPAAAAAFRLRFGRESDWGHLGDQHAFELWGIPWSFTTIPDHPDYHTTRDVVEATHPGFFVAAADYHAALVGEVLRCAALSVADLAALLRGE